MKKNIDVVVEEIITPLQSMFRKYTKENSSLGGITVMLSNTEFKKLSGRQTLKTAFINQVAGKLREKGLIVIVINNKDYVMKVTVANPRLYQSLKEMKDSLK